MGHLVDAAGSMVKDKKRAVEDKIKDAGGLGKFLAGRLSGIGNLKPSTPNPKVRTSYLNTQTLNPEP